MTDKLKKRLRNDGFAIVLVVLVAFTLSRQTGVIATLAFALPVLALDALAVARAPRRQ